MPISDKIITYRQARANIASPYTLVEAVLLKSAATDIIPA
jgi:hypothetical protein